MFHGKIDKIRKILSAYQIDNLSFLVFTNAFKFSRGLRDFHFSFYPSLNAFRWVATVQEKEKRRGHDIRNCFFSPVQCLLTIRMEKKLRRIIEKRGIPEFR